MLAELKTCDVEDTQPPHRGGANVVTLAKLKVQWKPILRRIVSDFIFTA